MLCSLRRRPSPEPPTRCSRECLCDTADGWRYCAGPFAQCLQGRGGKKNSRLALLVGHGGILIMLGHCLPFCNIPLVKTKQTFRLVAKTRLSALHVTLLRTCA